MFMTLEEQIQKLTEERDALRWDVEAYRGALGYPIPGSHTGKLTDGTVPQCGMCNSEYRKNLESERDAARADLKAIGECVGGDPLAVRGLVESMDAVIKERDAALKACAQKDDALQDCSQFPLGESLHYKVCSALDDNTCGKGYHHDDEWRPVVEALKDVEWGHTDMAGWPRCPSCGLKELDGIHHKDCQLKQALAHAEKLMSK